MTTADTFALRLADAADLLAELRASHALLEQVALAADQVANTLASGQKVLVAGNGGSMADAFHFAEEWTGRFRTDRRPYPVLALSADAAQMSCIANDYGFEQVFARSVRAFAQPGDLLILLSTSGNSPNLLRAAEVGRERGATVQGWLGRGGGRLAPLCHLPLLFPGTTPERIQELHMLCLHILIESAENRLANL